MVPLVQAVLDWDLHVSTDTLQRRDWGIPGAGLVR